MRHVIIFFWERNFALASGLFLCFGSLFALSTPWVLIPAIPLFFLIKKEHAPLMAILFFLPLLFFTQLYWLPPSKTPTEGIFLIKSIQKGTGFSTGWLYRGDLHTKGKIVPCTLFSDKRYPANQSYFIQGMLNTKNPPFYTLKTKEAWVPKGKRWQLAEWRFSAKQSVKDYIFKHISQKRAADFLTAMSTGQLEDPLIKKQFKELGISHVMAISGFHFALLTLAFHFFLRLFLPSKMESIFLIALLFCYFIFVGDSPSVQRAWAAITVFLLGELLEKRALPLNSLGVALIVTTIMNPLSPCSLGFQLSFLATGAILLLYKPIEKLLRLWIPKLSLALLLEKSLVWQHLYVARSLFREALALTLAVHVAVAPLLVYYFHSFSLNGLIYNLFFPLFAGWALLLLLISVPFPWLHAINTRFSEWLLDIADAPPLVLKTFMIESLHPGWVSLYLTMLGLIAVYLYFYRRFSSVVDDS